MHAPVATPVKAKKTSRVARGVATNELIFSAYQGTNDEVFPHILKLYVPVGARVADVTFGQGVFWKNVKKNAYRVKPSDLKMGIDCRSLPYESVSFDGVVFDPPYMHTPGGTAHQNHQNFELYYYNNQTSNSEKNITRLFSIFISEARRKHFASCARMAFLSSSAKTRFARIDNASRT